MIGLGQNDIFLHKMSYFRVDINNIPDYQQLNMPFLIDFLE
jgi:hypothetical protein